jgi:hypothetical protein
MQPRKARTKHPPTATPAPMPAFAPVLRPDVVCAATGRCVCEAEVDVGADVLASRVVELVPLLLVVVEIELAEEDKRVDVDDVDDADDADAVDAVDAVNDADAAASAQFPIDGEHMLAPVLAGSLKFLPRDTEAENANVDVVGHEHGRPDVTVLLF